MSMYGETWEPTITGLSRTKQSMKGETDINNIMKRYQQTGLLAHVAAKSPTYMDVGDVTDYREALEQVRITETFFEGLPAKIRARFEHSAAAFLDFITDPSKRGEAQELGLIPADPEIVPPIEGLGGGTVASPQARNADGTFEKGSEVRARKRAQAQNRDEDGRFEREEE